MQPNISAIVFFYILVVAAFMAVPVVRQTAAHT